MKVLLAEDDAVLGDALVTQFQGAGFAVEHAPNGAVAVYLLERDDFDVAVLDIGLPMLDGLKVLQQARGFKPGLPVILLSARDALDDRVAGLQAGADDYVTKPFDWPELLARVQALLRRTQGPSSAIQWQSLLLDVERRRVSVAGEDLELSGREWDLLVLLVQQRDKVVTKDQILQAWASDGGAAGAGNTIEVYVHRLRKKLEGAGLAIRTVRGLGYLLKEA